MITLIGVIIAVLIGLFCLIVAGNPIHVIGFLIGFGTAICLSFTIGLGIVIVTYIGLLIVTFEAKGK
jgi:hypothetical protein